MSGKYLFLISAFMLVVLVSGCIDTGQPPATNSCPAPKKIIGNVCCDDSNNNNVCDMDEAGCPASCDDSNACTNDSCSINTNFQCKHDFVYPCCGNNVCDHNEDINNICPQDCTIINITDFYYNGVPDFMDGSTFVFIHTTAITETHKSFFINITADNGDMENIRYTFRCNSTQAKNLDSITSVPTNITESSDIKINKLEDANYLIYSNFFLKRSPAYRLVIEKLNDTEKAQFEFTINKKEPQKRDELSCMFNFYFTTPLKMVQRPLKISYI